jgi:2-polyprenyl-3-methyl-5-hydroxy-6-metoxy-1,4-benzoquinol methylase
MSRIISELGRHLPKIKTCFENGGGIPYSEFRPDFTDAMDALWGRIYDEHLIGGFLGAVDGLSERLATGIRVLDGGCGTGHAVNLMARAYPRSNFAGYDIAEDLIAKARSEASQMRLSNAHFEVLDVTKLPSDPKFDLITAFDTVHDQRDPATMLQRVFDAVASDGMFFMVDFKFASDLQDNIGNCFAPLSYGISVMHCLTVSLAQGGEGLGTVWGIERQSRCWPKRGFPVSR